MSARAKSKKTVTKKRVVETLRSEYTVVRQAWEESERGWGVRPDGHTLHLTMEDWKAFVDGYNAAHNNLSYVPDEYTRTSGSPRPFTVDSEMFKTLEKNRKKPPKDPKYAYARFGVWTR